MSEANQREHWAKKLRRKKQQQEHVALVLRGTVAKDMMILAPLIVTMSRITGGRQKHLDSDNIVGSMKHVRDAIATILGVDDGHPSVEWRVDQYPGHPWGVEIRIEVKGAPDG